MYIPQNATPVTNGHGTAYLFTSESGKPAAIAYPKNAKRNPAFHYRFKNEQERAEYVQNWLNNLQAREDAKQAKRAEAKEWHHDLEVGDLLDGSWGYEQTNQEFYQVIETNPKTNSVVIQKVAQHMVEGSGGFMCEEVVPVKGKFIEPPIRRNARKGYDGKARITVDNFSLDKWDGRPKYQSHYA